MNTVEEPDWEWDSGTGGVTARRLVTRAPPGIACNVVYRENINILGIAARTRSRTQARSWLGWNRLEHMTGPRNARDGQFRRR